MSGTTLRRNGAPLTATPGGKLAELAKIQRSGNRVVLPLVEEHLLSIWGDQTGRDPRKVHVSEMAKKDWCERATWFRINQTGTWPEERFSFTMQSIFDEGHQIHDKWQTWLADSGHLWGDWRCLACDTVLTAQLKPLAAGCQTSRAGHIWRYAEVSFSYGLFSGHEDAAVAGRLVEFKSVGLGTLRRDSPGLLAKFYVQTTEGKKLYDLDALWKALKQPLMSHVRQANLYLWLAAMMADQGIPGYEVFDSASIVYEYKPNQQSREYVIPLSMDIVDPLVKRAGALAWASPPPCPYGGCKQCHDYDQAKPGPDDRARSAPGAQAGAGGGGGRVPARRLVHRSRGVADRGDDAPAGAVRRSGGRLHRRGCPEFGEAGHKSGAHLPTMEKDTI
jgi:hypothetical protein